MQFLATAEQMQQFDRSAINTYSLPGVVLMENAGRAFVDVLERTIPSLPGKSILIVCGKGNNGGDDFVIARHLANRGSNVHVVLLCKRKDMKGDAKTQLDILLKMIASKKSSIAFEEVFGSKQLVRFINSISHHPSDNTTLTGEWTEARSLVIIDAIFGTGFSGEVKGVHKQAIEWINSQKAFVAAVDIPSGVNATTGVVENIAVKANLTVAMALAKIGHYVGSGRDHSGSVEIVDIGIPKFMLRHSATPTLRIEVADVKRMLPRRPKDSHKNTVGRVLVLAGSRNLTGAPFMAAQSAMKAGAGAVVLGVPRSIHAALIRKVTEVMVTPLEETSDGSLSLAAMEEIRKKIQWADVIAIGPGLSLHEETQHLVHQLLKSTEKPIVLDADGINAMASHGSILTKRKFPTILTPHVGELRTLSELASNFIETHRIEVARTSAKQLRSIVCLKGSPTAIGAPDGKVFLNATGNPGMATAGSGDVLTGIVSSFFAQGMAAEEAAYCGVFVHGMAGDIAAKKFGERSMMALDILACISETLKAIETA